MKEQVVAGVIVAAIVAVAGAIGASLAGWWPKIFGLIGGAWNWFGSSSQHPNWLLLLLWGVFSSGYCVFQCGFSIIFVVLVSLKLLGEIIVAITSMGLTGSGIILLALTLK
ncbi:hypothetical protein U5F73_15430 [Stenotrophomonas pavanii]|uniref:hypothetical protein n=1 Tax=Stenotrophomonas pavanii TaxID=487698 RepID=UPI002ACE3596|nr:hypothetical protein [Stenotrophomonas pavanii]MDZ7476368.1 hypothetical protein [Stenotrophomonas pavanii]